MHPPPFARLPAPPYYAVIFSSAQSADTTGYGPMAERMVELAQGQPGFLGVESSRDTQGFGITVSYWSTLEAIAHWRTHAEHQVAQETGKARWYTHYELRVALVETAYGKRPTP